MQQDTYRHKGLRRKLIRSLRKKGIADERVLEAMERIPRHLFLDKAFEEWAYRDVPFPIGNDQTISQPFTVAYQTELLALKPRDRVLEIGTGSGYQACVLAEMGVKVYTVERVQALFERTQVLLERLGYRRIRAFLRDGHDGLPRFAPYDAILVTAAANDIPEPLLEQLAIGGRLVIPVGRGETQEMLRITRKGPDQFDRERFGAFRFVRFQKGLDTE
ncbi:MAG: protein-L-isoaspartate(D-aspartate) O-methyltransferase [Saprospiraceae bacterium]|nr:protein-L-isoaspartate(D-aspartate) O-methyltransferase [Saprospiraceae bacterium]